MRIQRTQRNPLLWGLPVLLLLVAAFTSGEQMFAQVAKAKEFAHAMHRSMAAMQRDMESVPMTGDADRDFVAMMIPHHKGALDMARSELLYGQDPVLRRLAQEILVDQQSEIDAMQRWLGKHPVNTRPGIKQ